MKRVGKKLPEEERLHRLLEAFQNFSLAFVWVVATVSVQWNTALDGLMSQDARSNVFLLAAGAVGPKGFCSARENARFGDTISEPVSTIHQSSAVAALPLRSMSRCTDVSHNFGLPQSQEHPYSEFWKREPGPQMVNFTTNANSEKV